MHQALTPPEADAPAGVLTRDELARLNLFKDASFDAEQAVLKSCPVHGLKVGEILVRAGWLFRASSRS